MKEYDGQDGNGYQPKQGKPWTEMDVLKKILFELKKIREILEGEIYNKANPSSHIPEDLTAEDEKHYQKIIDKFINGTV